MLTGQLFAMFVLATGFSALLTLVWTRHARARRIEDQPGQRRLHSIPTPRGGGIAIALVLLAALAWISMNLAGSADFAGLAAGVGLFAALGLLDDLLPMPALAKFALQLLAAGAMILIVSQGWALGWLTLACLIVAGGYVVNVWNFMDGSNGLITVQALLIASALALWPEQSLALRLFAVALAGACLGFLPFNFPRAHVFLGDVGSHALGAAVFGLLLLSWHGGAISLAQALLMGTVLLLDSGYTLARRALAGRKVWRAHREHLYQYAVRRGNSHTRVCLSYGAATGFCILLAAIGEQIRLGWLTWVLFIVSWLLGTVAYGGLRRHWLQVRPTGDRKHGER